MKSTLIADTTRAEREELVRRSLEYSDLGCDDAVNGWDFYLPYIEGRLELRELNEQYSKGYLVDMDTRPRGRSCPM